MPAAAFSASLPTKPRLKSEADVDAALRELSWLQAETQRIEGECQRDIAAVKSKYQGRFVVEVDGEPFAFADRGLVLEGAVAKYAEANRAELLGDEKKSRDFTHGTIGYRRAPASLEYLDGYDADRLQKIVEGTCRLWSKVAAVVAKCFPIARVAASSLFDVKITPNKSRIKKSVEVGALSDKDLKALGMRVAEGEESFYLKVNDFPVQSEASA